jgi:hypothetical protein
MTGLIIEGRLRREDRRYFLGKTSRWSRPGHYGGLRGSVGSAAEDMSERSGLLRPGGYAPTVGRRIRND